MFGHRLTISYNFYILENLIISLNLNISLCDYNHNHLVEVSLHVA